MFFMALLFFVGHYCVYAMPMDMTREICMVCSSALLGLCLFGAFFLLVDFRGMRSRRIFALQMLLVALTAGFSVMRILLQDDLVVGSSRLLSAGMLIYGNVYAFIMLMYPLELLYPGRLTVGRYAKLFLPVLVAGLLYAAYIRLTGYQMICVYDWQELLANIHKFDVWFRLTLVVYPVWMFVVIMYQKKRYICWCRKNYSAEEFAELSWLDYYLFGYLLIMVSYVVVLPMHNPQSLLMHSLCILMFFSYSLYNILRQEVSGSSKRSIKSDLVAAPEVEYPAESRRSEIKSVAATEDKYRFVDKIPEFKIVLERWMETEKPHLNKNFKLLDVMQVLPLNRSYLSRMFNEAYGETFFSFIMRYRIEESVKMLDTRPELTVVQIAQACGFSSASVFGRAFLKHMGATPKEYRNR